MKENNKDFSFAHQTDFDINKDQQEKNPISNKQTAATNIFKSLDDFKFDFDEDLLNPSKTFMNKDELKLTQKKTAKDFFSSSSSEDEGVNKREKNKKLKKAVNKDLMVRKSSENSSISEFSSDNEKKINILEIYGKQRDKNRKKNKLEKYKIKNKFLLEDYKKYKDAEDLESFYNKKDAIERYSAEAIIKKFNKLSSSRKQRKFLEKFELKDIKFDKIDVYLTIDLNSDKDIFTYGALQMKDVPIFKRISYSKIIGIKNEKVSREILKELNEMTGQYDKDLDEGFQKRNKDKKNLRYFKKSIYTKALLDEFQNKNMIKKIEDMNVNSSLEKKKGKFKELIHKKIEENSQNEGLNAACISKTIENSLDDYNLLESLNFEILFEKYFKTSFNRLEFLEEKFKKYLYDPNKVEEGFPGRSSSTTKRDLVNKNFISFNPNKNINSNESKQNFFSVISTSNNMNLDNIEDDPLSLSIDFSQLSQSENSFLTKNAEYNKKLNSDPENIVLWIEYINYQDELFIANPNMFKNEKNKLEVKINIIEKALKSDKNKKNYVLNILRLRILNKLHFDNFNQVNLYWMIAFDNFYLEKNFLNEYLITLKKQQELTISDLKDYYLALIKFYEMKLAKTEKDKKAMMNRISKFIIDILFDLISIDKKAGYIQRSFIILRALLEVKILEFKNILNPKNTNFIKDYEEYFESGFPKIGDLENSKGFLDYKEKKIKVNKELFQREDFIDNIPLLKNLNDNISNIKDNKLVECLSTILVSAFDLNDLENEEIKSYIFNQIMQRQKTSIKCFRPLNPVLDYERIENEPENFLFYSDAKDFIEVKIKLNSEILTYLISKTISYFTGFEIDNEICFSCKKDFIYDTKQADSYHIENQIFFSKFYLTENKSIKVINNFQLLIYLIRFFKYLEEMNIYKKEMKILEMDFTFMMNHPNYKNKILSIINTEGNKETIKSSNINELPFTDINQYAKGIFGSKENQNDIDLWINYYDWLMIYEKFNEAEKILKVINSKKPSDLKFQDNLKIKFTIINHYFYSYLFLNDDKKYNKRELINLIFNSLSLISEGELNESPLDIIDRESNDDNFFANFNMNYLRIISQYEKAEMKLQFYLNSKSDSNIGFSNSEESLFDEFDIENLFHYAFILFLVDFSFNYLKLQNEMYSKIKGNLHLRQSEIMENLTRERRNIILKSYMKHFKKIKTLEKYIKERDDNESNVKFKIKKIHCSHFLSQEFSRCFYKFYYFITDEKYSNKRINQTLNLSEYIHINNLFIGDDFNNLFILGSTPTFNIRLLKLLNFSLDNKNDFFIYIISHFLNKFENPLDREISFLNHFGENLNLKQSLYFINSRYKNKFNSFKKYLNNLLKERENKDSTLNSIEFSNMQINITQIIALFKDFWKNSESNSSRLKRNFNFFFDDIHQNNSVSKENLFVLYSPIESFTFNTYWKVSLDLLFNYMVYYCYFKEEPNINYISKFAEYVLFVNHEFSLNVNIFKDSMDKILILILALQKKILKDKDDQKEKVPESVSINDFNKEKKSKFDTIKINLEETFKNLNDLIRTRELKI